VASPRASRRSHSRGVGPRPVLMLRNLWSSASESMVEREHTRFRRVATEWRQITRRPTKGGGSSAPPVPARARCHVPYVGVCVVDANEEAPTCPARRPRGTETLDGARAAVSATPVGACGRADLLAVAGESLWPLTRMQPAARLVPSRPMGSGVSSAVTKAARLTQSRRGK
jgi:hypothetical protein